MGITGLIPFLEKATSKTTLDQLPRNSTAAIDAYCWLHKGAFACADLLARGETTDIHIHYCLKYVKLLLSHGIRPILVFDGRHLPAKALTEEKRRENRQTAKLRAAELMRLGRHDEARSQLRRCVDITHEMALQLIQRCRAIHVDCIVAPYEADGQLAYLSRSGLADYVITEDSDLILFGCQRILFKLDLGGSCLLMDAALLPAAMGCKPERYSFEKFRYMCIMSGCDYLDSLPGIGLAKACKFVLMLADDAAAAEMRRALGKIPAYLKMRHLEVTDEYRAGFLRANATFQHMVVYDPRRRKLVRLSDPLELADDADYCDNAGEFFDEALAFQLALGNVDPFTLRQLDEWSPDDVSCGKKATKYRSIWHRAAGQYEQDAELNDADEKQHARRPIKFRDSPKEAAVIKHELVEDLLSVYTSPSNSVDGVRRPPLFDPLEKSPNLSRNPFGVQQDRLSPANLLKSPTKICSATSSLLRQCSPVKRIESPFVAIDAAAAAQRSPRKSLDRFRTAVRGVKRTVIDDRQNVLSRFFAANRKEATAPVRTTTNADVVDELSKRMGKIEETIKQVEETTATFYQTASPIRKGDHKACEPCDDSVAVSPRTKSPSRSPPTKKSCRTLFASPENDITTDDDEKPPAPAIAAAAEDTMIDLTTPSAGDDDEKPSIITNKTNHKLPPAKAVKAKATCRQPGQRRTTSSAKSSSSTSTQSRLSAFGFSKKSM